MALTPGSRLGPYEIISALGAGGIGEVHRARDRTLDRDISMLHWTEERKRLVLGKS